MVGDDVTYADYGWFVMYEMLIELKLGDFIKTTAPKLYELADKVILLPETAEYILHHKNSPASLPLF